MAVIHGKNMVLTSSGNTVAHLTNLSYEETTALADATAMGDTQADYEAGIKDGTFTASGWYDPADSTAQGTLRSGSVLNLIFYPNGNSSGNPSFTQTAVDIETFTVTAVKDAVIEFSCTGKGVFTEGTV